MSDAGKKRPTRKNAGKIERFGDYVDHTQKKKKAPPIDVNPSQKGSSTTKSSGGKTVKWVASQIRQVHDEAEDKIFEMEEEFREAEKAYKMLEVDKTTLESQIRKLECQIDDMVINPMTEEEKKEAKVKLESLRDEMDTLTTDIRRAEIRLDVDREELEQNRIDLRREASVEQARIEEENGDDSESDLSVPDYVDTVNRWETDDPNLENNQQQSYTGFAAETHPFDNLISSQWTPSPTFSENPMGYYRESHSTPQFVSSSTPQSYFDPSAYGATSLSFVPPSTTNPTTGFKMCDPPPRPAAVKMPTVTVTTSTPIVTSTPTVPVAPVISNPSVSAAGGAPTPIVTMASAVPMTVPSVPIHPSAPPPPPHGFGRNPYPTRSPAVNPFQFQNFRQHLPGQMSNQARRVATIRQHF